MEAPIAADRIGWSTCGIAHSERSTEQTRFCACKCVRSVSEKLPHASMLGFENGDRTREAELCGNGALEIFRAATTTHLYG